MWIQLRGSSARSIRLKIAELRAPQFLRAAAIAAFGALEGCSKNEFLTNHAGWNDAPEAMMPVQPWIMTHSRRRSQSGGALSEFWRSLKIYSPAPTFLFPHLFLFHTRTGGRVLAHSKYMTLARTHATKRLRIRRRQGIVSRGEKWSASGSFKFN